MLWKAGELERAQAFYAGRAGRIQRRAEMQAALTAWDPAPALIVFENYQATVDTTLTPDLRWRTDPRRRTEAEPEFPDMIPNVNQNIW